MSSTDERIAENQLNRAREVVRRSGLAADLEQQLRAGIGGAPRRLAVEVLLAACITVHGRTHPTASLVEVHRVLTNDLHPSAQIRAGTRWHRQGRPTTITLRQVRYLFKRICTLLDYSPHTASHLTSAERAAREDDFVTKINNLVLASHPWGIPQTETSAIDATAMPSAARPRRRPPSSANEADYRSDDCAWALQRTGSADPDGRWDHQTKTHENGRNSFFGLTAIMGAGVHAPDSPFRSLHLVQMMTVVPNGYNKPAPTLRLLDTYTANAPLRRILVDRGFSSWVPEAWATPLRERGLEQVFDLHSSERGARLDPVTGVLMIDGWPHAPWTPKHLHNIPRPARFKVVKPPPGASREKHATYQKDRALLDQFKAAIAELGRYALQPNTAPRRDGSRQFKTPAYRRNHATAAQRRTKVFTQATILLPATVWAKQRQHHRWGSDEWIESYSPRTIIEGVFGSIKTRENEFVRRGWIRLVGIVPTTLMAAFAVVHYNLRTARAWAAKNDFHSDDILLAPDPEDDDETTDTTDLNGAIGPPQAA